jgi:hypothetical protein
MAAGSPSPNSQLRTVSAAADSVPLRSVASSFERVVTGLQPRDDFTDADHSARRSEARSLELPGRGANEFGFAFEH